MSEARGRSIKPALILAALLMPALAAHAAGAELVDIHWASDGRFVHQANLAPGQFIELCGKLPAGQIGRAHV